MAFQTAFTAWATAALPELADEQVCVEGKAVWGSRDGATGAVHMMSAFAGRARWMLFCASGGILVALGVGRPLQAIQPDSIQPFQQLLPVPIFQQKIHRLATAGGQSQLQQFQAGAGAAPVAFG